jgi:hypothetical protein
VYQIFEITLKQKKIDLEKTLTETKALGWFVNGPLLVKDDDGLQYVLDLSNLTLRCVIGELFPIDEGTWVSLNFPSREDLVNAALVELEKLPFKLEITEILRLVKHV